MINPGMKFGRLEVISKSELRKNRHILWNCKCECGIEKLVSSYHLTSGKIKSCGCYRYEVLVSKETKKRLPKNQASKNALLCKYKRGAKERNIKFNLSKDLFERMLESDCHYCGEGPSNILDDRYYQPFRYNGIDRVDNEKGYEDNNCVPCCCTCNYAKRQMSHELFMSWIKKVYEKHYKEVKL